MCTEELAILRLTELGGAALDPLDRQSNCSLFLKAPLERTVLRFGLYGQANLIGHSVKLGKLLNFWAARVIERQFADRTHLIRLVPGNVLKYLNKTHLSKRHMHGLLDIMVKWSTYNGDSHNFTALKQINHVINSVRLLNFNAWAI